MKNIIILFSLFILNTSFAKTCICQYPTQGSTYGYAENKEVIGYKLGCKLWLINQSHCRQEIIVNINKDLEEVLQGLGHQEQENISIGFVGHWQSTSETASFIDQEIIPLFKKFNSDIFIDNTACFSMGDPEQLNFFISHYEIPNERVLKVRGVQTRSIGMWDELIPHLSKTDITATVSSDQKEVYYPRCEKHFNKKCVEAQINQVATCRYKNQNLQLKCDSNKKKWILK